MAICVFLGLRMSHGRTSANTPPRPSNHVWDTKRTGSLTTATRGRPTNRHPNIDIRIRMEGSAFGINACDISDAAARTHALNQAQVRTAEKKLRDFHARLTAFAAENIIKDTPSANPDQNRDTYSLPFDSVFAEKIKSDFFQSMADIGGNDFAIELLDQVTHSSKFLRLGQYNVNFTVEDSINQRTGKQSFTVTVSFLDPSDGKFCGSAQAPLSAFNANYIKIFE